MRNPGPPLIINNNQISHLNAFTVAHRSSQSLLVSSSTSHLGLHFVRYANLPRCLTYSRNDLLKIRFRSGDLKPSAELLARLKNVSLLRYRGKRSGKKRNKCLHSSITVLTGRRCVTPLRPPGPRIQTLIPVSLSVDLETPTGLRAQRSVVFSLFNARSVKNKRLLIKDWVVVVNTVRENYVKTQLNVNSTNKSASSPCLRTWPPTATGRPYKNVRGPKP